jgi:hypothetical protein
MLPAASTAVVDEIIAAGDVGASSEGSRSAWVSDPAENRPKVSPKTKPSKIDGDNPFGISMLN